MIQDTVTEDIIMRKPKFIAFLFTTIFICFFIFDPSQSIVGHLLEPALGDPEKSGFYGRCVTASMSAVLLVLNLLAISWIPNFRLQVITVWLQLLILFLSFFYSFDLSFEFIRSKIWFMVTQGIFTTLYVSAISIVIASFIAIIGAVG